MRRGLKRILSPGSLCPSHPGFKPIPDEEGTETNERQRYERGKSFSFKPIPDEEGTETHGNHARP